MLSLKAVLRFASVAVAVVLPTLAQAQAPEPSLSVRSPPVSYNNTLVKQRADPQILKHTNGRYYFIATVPEYDRVVMRQADSIQGLSTAEERLIWARSQSKAGVGYVWAPELHKIGDKWYIYFALGRTAPFDVRPFVLEGTGSDDPMAASWAEKGFITTDFDTFSLDATTFEVNGVRYLSWAQADPRFDNGGGTSLFLARMTNPWTIQRPSIVISRPDQPWERIGHNVNEGSWGMVRNGKVFVTYSAAATDANYCMGLLTADQNADLMNPASWSKSKDPVFVSNTATSQFGPGHSAFTVSDDNQSDVLVYHARQYKDIRGEPLDNPDRMTRVQKLYWRSDGTPDFGIPIPDGPHPVRLRSSADQTLYVGIANNAVQSVKDAPVQNTQFKIVEPGLGGSGTISFESTAQPGKYLSAANGSVSLATLSNTSDAGARSSASFRRVAGLSDATGVSFESAAQAGSYLVSGGNGAAVSVAPSTGAEATFYLE
ncbi:hypothetical protein MCOR27_011418 [Pyricularia oryzae]|uniref:Alpha-L-arabinofuranosidase B n=4 Tax=Pyricularia oryzae TaxID=318829 RepID=ABFB_PYRO7|nr:alpha-N-arabinofuranosidase 2 [Pyricularia oryzae 70-15]G4MMH2.1 RecName: Full=Alpha-L-arabinofuranosidase B; AltName: Full=Alpha-N-arabinofuranosidase B; Flags: Precursor [Pyricularia oryzae 70-15]ELQ43696.1 alpha-N-arabinofuranosidase 2 [Pyricularia oryzae Y34]KAH8842291.1 hypothetical protein MCOR01_006209 [Pyricularia oryzae]EHA56950.1 alpha-N-arabinofuranosidase 2 [Pyricularia oryzae 70-15]KAH9435526.1 hypothetical protein MCOR02_004452 [Pyricularia oryzae]KAI6258390.1 hypothetical pr